MIKRSSIEQQVANSLKRNKARKQAQRDRARRRLINHRSLQMESLEERIVLAANLFIEYGDNFPGGTLSTTQGAFRDVANHANGPDRILGTPLPQSNGFTAGGGLDIVSQPYSVADRARALAVVQRAFAGLDVNIIELTGTNQTTPDGRVVQGASSMADVITTLRGGNATWKDAYIFVGTFIADPGGPNQVTYGGTGGGLSPSNTLGEISDLNSASNVHDDVAVVFSAGGFGNNTRNNIAHEAGHNFGLRHSITNSVTSNPSNAVAPAAINLFHQAEIMSYRNTNNTTSSVAFTRYPMIRGDGNSPSSGILGNYNSIAARMGTTTLYDQAANDANIGPNPNWSFVSGTGAHDIITITRNGANADVTVEAFAEAAHTTAITVPSVGGTVFSYSIPLTNSILVQAGGSDDHVIVDGDLGVDLIIDGMLGNDTLAVNAGSSPSATYVPNPTIPVGVDLVPDMGGTITIGGNTITFNNFEPLELNGFTTAFFQSPNGVDNIDLEIAPAPISGNPSTRVFGTSGGVGFEDLFVLNTTNLIVDLATNDGAGVNGEDVVDINATDGITNLILDTGQSADVVDATPSPNTEFFLEGNSPTTAPGDVLNYDAAGGNKVVTGINGGTIEKAGFMDVNFSGFEFVTPTGGNTFTDEVDVASLVDALGDTGSDGTENLITIRRDGGAGTNLEILFDGDTGTAGGEIVVSTQPFATITELTVNGAGDDDILFVDVSNGLLPFVDGISFDGAGQGAGGDMLRIEGDPDPSSLIQRETHFATAADSGDITYDPNGNMGVDLGTAASGDEMFISYTALEPVFDTVPVAQANFFTPAGAVADNISITDGPVSPGGFQTLEVDAATFETQWFANKDTLTVNSLDGADFYTIDFGAVIDGITTLELYGNELTGGTIDSDDSATDDFRIQGTSAAIPTYLHGQDGSDNFIHFFPTANLDDILGVVNIIGGESLGDDDFVALMDVNDATPDSATLTSTSLTGASPAVINYVEAETFFYESTNGDDSIEVISTALGTRYLVSGDGGGDVITIGNESGDVMVNPDGSLSSDGGSLDLIAGEISILPDANGTPGVDVLNVDDSGTSSLATGVVTPATIDIAAGFSLTSGLGFFITGDVTELTGFAPATIRYFHTSFTSLLASNTTGLEFANILASDGDDSIDVNATTATDTTRLDSHIGDDANTTTINGDGLSADNIFHGSAGFDRTVLNVTANLGATSFVDLTGLIIHGDDPANDTNQRDSVEINDNSGAARDLVFDYIDTAGGVDINPGGGGGLGAGVEDIPVEIRTMETLIYNGSGAGDTVEVEGTSSVDQLTVAPLSASGALVFLGGNPWDGPSDVDAFLDAYPGLAGGGNGPDMQILGITPGGPITFDDGDASSVADDDQLFVYAPSETGISDASTIVDPWDPAGVGNGFTQGGAGQLIPAFGAPPGGSSHDDIFVSDAGVSIDNGPAPGIGPLIDVAIADPTEDFVKTNAATELRGLIVNSGDEALPDAGDGIADDIFAVLSFNFGLQINGGNPVPGFAPQGDRLQVITPGEINVFSDKSTPPEVSITSTHPLTNILSHPLTFSSIESAILTPGVTNQQVNLYGDDNTGVGQEDNFVVVGRDIDSLLQPLGGPGGLAANPAYNPTGATVDPRYDVDADGDNEFELFINGSAAIGFRNVTDLNVFGDDDNAGTASPDEIDTLEITPYADDTPQGWDIDVAFDEGNPVQADGDQADLIILHTSLLGGQVSENIVVQPTGPEDGEIIVTNASSGALIVDIDYVNNLDIIINDDDGFANDTDTLTLRGTDPSTPATSGREIFDINFGAAGDLANPEVVVTDADPVVPAEPILYRIRDLINIQTVTFESLGGDDTFNVTPDGDVAVEIYGGSPIGAINGDPDILNVLTADTGETVNFFPGPEADSGTFTIAMGAAAERSVSFDEIELLQVDNVAFVIQDDYEEIDYNAANIDPNNSLALATDIGSDVTAVYRDLTLHTTNGSNAGTNPTTTDIDFYRYTAHYTGKLAVNASFIHNDGDIAISVQDAAGNPITASLTPSAAGVNREDLVIPVVVGEDYVIVVQSADAVPTTYTLEIENFAAPVPSGVDLNPNDDSGASRSDNVTFVGDGQLLIHADLTDFNNMGVPLLESGDFPAAAGGAAVEAFINGVSIGFADRFGGTSTNFWTIDTTAVALAAGIPIDLGTLTAGDIAGFLDLVTSAVTVFDGAAAQNSASTLLSEPMWMNFDPNAPEAANISVAMLDASDTNIVGDQVTKINQPAFWGVAEENTKIRIFADLLRDGTFEMVGEATVGSDRSDVASNANLPEGSLGGAADDGVGLWEITVEPLRDGLYDIRVEVEDLAGNVTVDTARSLAIEVDTLAPQRPTVDLVGMDVQDSLTQFDFTGGAIPVVTLNTAPVNSDTGLSGTDDITRGTNPAPAAGGQGTTDVMLRVSAEPDSTVFLKDGEEVIATFTMPSLPYANQGPGGDIFVFVLVTLDEDPHPLSVEAFDLAGNRSIQSEELLVIVDTTDPPTAVATDLIESSDTFDDFAGITGPIFTDVDDNTGINTPTFSGVAEKNSLVRVWATDTVTGTLQLVGEGTVGSDESDFVTDGLGLYSVETVAMADGNYDISVELEDTAGNISSFSDALNITIDTLAPQRPTVDLQDSDDSGRSDMDNTTISDPAEANGIVDVRVSAELGSRVIIKDGETVIDDFVFNAAFDATDGGATDGFGLRRIDFPANTVAFGIPTEGAHPISVEAFDTPGNRSAQSEELLITIDFTPPVATAAPNLLSSSDSGQENDDNVTNVQTPAFDGVGERNSIVRIFATPTAGNTGVRQLIGEGIVGSNESDGDRAGSLPEQLGFWEVTVEPLEDGVWDITTTLEDKAGNISAESAALTIEIDTYQPNTPFLDLVEASDSGRHNDDNITNDNTPTLTMTSHDPNNADHIDPLNFIFRIYDREEQLNEVLLYDSLADLGDFTALTFLTETTAVLADNIHNLKLEVEDRAGNISEDFLLDILIDTVAYAGEGDLHPESDSGISGYDATFTDHYTNDKLPEFYGSAEANNLVIMEIDSGAGFFPAGTTVALPYDGDDAFQPQNAPNDIVEGNWWIQTTIDDADGSLLADGEHDVRFTYEDVAGNRTTPAPFQIFIDSEGPVVTNVTHGQVYEQGVFAASVFDGETSLFDPKPSTGPEPLVSSVVVHFSDGPARTLNFQQDALFLATAIEEGHFSLVGDANGVIPILAVNIVTAMSRSGFTITDSSPGADAILGLELVVHQDGGDGILYSADDTGEPLPDDRFTLVVSDSLTDDAGNALDGESGATAPFDGNNFNLATPPVFPSGDGSRGGDFAARFTNDTVAELGVWAAGNVWVDTNGNFHFDPENTDSSNRDITYAMGFVTDDVFAGNFIEARVGTADGFDKIGAYGFVGGVYRWLIDTDNDGVADIDNSNSLADINGLPIVGRFDGNNANGDEVGVFTGTTWYLDSNHSFSIDAGDTTFSGDMRGLPTVGDFDGDGNDDLATWHDDHFYIDFAADGLDGNADADFEFGFIGTREAPIAADFDGDDIDDIGLWVPGREGVTPREGAEWFVLMSHGQGIANHIRFDARLGINVADFEPDPFGYDFTATFGDEFARPVVGNFDPPNLGGGGGDDGGDGGLVQFDVNGDGEGARVDDAMLQIRTLKTINDATGAPNQKLFAAAVAAPFADIDGDLDIDLVDAFKLIVATEERFHRENGGGGAAEGEGASLDRIWSRLDSLIDNSEPELRDLIFSDSDDDDDDRVSGLVDSLSDSLVTDEDVDEFFSDF